MLLTWTGAAAEAAHAASGQAQSKTPLLHAWPLCHSDTWTADAAWLSSMEDMEFPLNAVDDSGHTLLHRAVQVWQCLPLGTVATNPC